MLGARGNDEFKHPEVVAVNKFRAAMSGQKEKVDISDNGQVLVVSRGKKVRLLSISAHCQMRWICRQLLRTAHIKMRSMAKNSR